MVSINSSHGSGYGSGYGFGDGSGYGSGYGDSYGSGDGDGSGSGYGSGYGYGDGSGYGSGYGDSYGSGDGDGSGSGYGYGYGYGFGDGSGYGSGYGDGSGSGYGYSDGYGDDYWRIAVQTFKHVLSENFKQRCMELESIGAVICYWRSDSSARPANGGTKTIASPGLVEEVQGPLKICTRNALHGTFCPYKWKGERLWLVALIGETQSQEDKIGALKREIICELIP